MQFISLWTPAKPMNPTPEHMGEMQALVEEMTKNGSLVSTGPLGPAKQSVSVMHSGAKYRVEDAPDAFGGAKAQGYAILEAPTMDAAIELSKKFMAVAGEGECQLRAIAMPPHG